MASEVRLFHQVPHNRKGNFADIVILRSNPLDDIKNASDIDTVIKNGVIYPADKMIPTPATTH